MGEIRTYTSEELLDPSLPSPPGWRSLGDLPAIVNSVEQPYGWNPVLSVSIFRDDPDREGHVQTLTAIRGAATTHQDVVSTLTGQFPAEWLPGLVKKRQRYVVGRYPRVSIGNDGPNPQETAVIAEYEPQLEGVPDPGSALPFLCHDIISRKLGRADLVAMQSHDELGTASLARLALGVSYTKDDNEGQPRYERLLMVGVAFMLHPHYAHVFDTDYHERMSVLPPEERRYRSLGWTSIGTFSNAVKMRNGIELAPYVPEGDAATVCVRGQCLAMTSLLVDAPDLMWHLGRADRDKLDYGVSVGDPYGIRDRVPRKR